MKNLGEIRQAGKTYTFEVNDDKELFLNGEKAIYTTNKRGFPVVKVGDFTMENIGVMKFRLENAGLTPEIIRSNYSNYKPQKFSTYDNVFETWDMDSSERRQFERGR